MNSLKLERHYLKMFDLKDVEIIELHGFSGASLKAYAPLIYTEFKLKDGSYTSILLQVKLKLTLQKEKT